MRTAPVCIGDADLIATYEVHGERLRATMTEPEEFPEVELLDLLTPHGETVRGLLEFAPVYDSALEQVTEHEREASESDPDDAYDRARDEQLERT